MSIIGDLTGMTEVGGPRPMAGPIQPLLHVPGATEGTSQWKAQLFQVVNWGGFEGHEEFRLDPGVTLISGASGTGKSTVLDAYLALMMPSDTPFNGASNDAGGRARNADQRNLLSYLRGQTDTMTDESGHEQAQVLRGRGSVTWGALAMTFVNDRGERFTAMRVYYVPARATTTNDMTMRMATFDGYVDLRDLEPLVAGLFAPAALKKTFPGLATHDTYTSFSDRLFTKLGIGAGGDGTKALKLLARIQAGHQIRTVDALYKDMVLETPDTFAKADQALADFDELEATYRSMQLEARKADLLEPIGAKHAQLTAAQATIERIDLYGLTLTGPSPFTAWRLGREEQLIEATIATNREQLASHEGKLTTAQGAARRLRDELDAVKKQHAAAGGDQLDELDGQIETAQAEESLREGRLVKLAAATTAVQATFDDAATFAAVQDAGRQFLDGYDAQLRDLEDQVTREDRAAYPLHIQQAELKADLEFMRGRRGRVDRYLDGLRQQVCGASGMSADELPFLAELIDVLPDHARWRTAIECVLGSSARLLLVPADRLDEFSTAIDAVHLRGRLRYQGVPLRQGGANDPDLDRIAGKLEYDEASPYIGWVKAHVSARERNALCVLSPTQLRGPGPRVTLAGQERSALSGQHGRARQENIIGFSNEDALTEIEHQLEEVTRALGEHEKRRQGLLSARARLGSVRDAYLALTAQDFTDIDVWSAGARVEQLRRDRDQVLAADDQLAVLAAQMAQLSSRAEEAQRDVWQCESQVKSLNDAWVKLVDRKDAVVGEALAIDAAGTVVLTDEQVAALDGEFDEVAAPGDPADLGAFDTNIGRLRERLTDRARAAVDTRAEAAADLERIFATYLRDFPDPNLGQSAQSYPDYAAILQEIRTVGLHERRAAWRERLTQWSGEDLVPLAQAMVSSVQEIEDRLVPINEILAGLPFGAMSDRLRITLRRLNPDAVTRFTRDLRTLSRGATQVLDEAGMERRFLDLVAFMARLRPRDDPKATGERDRLLDVRLHVEIKAERYDEYGVVRATHSHLGGKSGGETQELVAFIVGAALRFRLGDELRERPRFAPVFLDEGFIKADAQFAGRAVAAWRGLGFQLVIAAPVDKFTALEPHTDLFIAVTKNVRSGYAFVSHVQDATREQG